MRKAQRGKKEQIKQLALALAMNGEAKQDRHKKSWSIHDLRKVYPITDNQKVAFELFEQDCNVILNGSAGTGKTFLALFKALEAVIATKQQDRIVICRSAVPCRDQGFLPGTLEEKGEPYEAPYAQLCTELLGKRSSYQDLKDAGIIEFVTTGYLRGITLDNTIIIADEMQNFSFHEISTLVTRLGENSRLFVSADCNQTDLRKSESGYNRALRVFDSIPEFQVVTFGHNDIVRSDIVKKWIIACELVN